MSESLTKRLILVSSRLPFQLVKVNQSLTIKESDGGLVSALKSYLERSVNPKEFISTLWLGSAEFSENSWVELNKKKLEHLSYTVEPIFIERKTYARYYNGFCNATIWPLFHYFPSFVEFDAETFRAYEEVNRTFADRILVIVQPNDTIWIHDYQLMLVPAMIREKLPSARVGFFLHIPFPSFEIFRMLHHPWKQKIIDGLLGADLIGFHTNGYVQHFLKTVQMVRGFDHKFRTIFMPNRIAKAEMFPLGIDFEKFHTAAHRPEVIEKRDVIQSNFKDIKIIFSVDRLDYTKGITHRLAGFECFLEHFPEWKGKVVFLMVVVPSRQIVSKYNERKKLIEEEIGRINGKYSTLGWQAIIYRYSCLDFEDLIAMYNAADIGLITPLRDGMNLVSKEYLASRTNHGVLILSELAGAANELGEAILVNPLDQEEVAQAILQALLMPEDIQQKKIEILQGRLREYTVSHWLGDFINQLEETKSRQMVQQSKHISSNIFKEIVEKYQASETRLLLLDYDGRLVPYSKHPMFAVPDKRLIKLLTLLASDAQTDLTIISGRDSDSLEKWFGALPVGLVSEHGAGIRPKGGFWQHDPDIDQSWKSHIRPMLEIFTQRTPDSFIENKLHTLVWHYRSVERELGFVRSRELVDNLHHLTRNANLNIIEGNKVIEVRVSGIDKGVVTRKILEERRYDFVLAMGDDKTDEDMFRVLSEKAFTLKIGPGQTAAQYNLNDPEEVFHLLSELPKQSN